MNCPSCEAVNDAANRYCSSCGAVMAATPTCRSCGTSLAAGARFCVTCGTAVAPVPEVPQGPGYVVDGEWQRAPGELVRRVPGDAMRSAFGRLVPGVDWGGFFGGGLAGKVVDLLLSKSIRVPMGSVGALTRDGRVVKVLPPGEQTTPGLLREIVAGELSTAQATAQAVIERVLRPDHLVLYLIDRRPIPVSFTVEQPQPTGNRTLQVTALVSVGANADALTAFLGDVVGDRDTLAAEDLYVRFRSEIERAVADAVRARPNDAPAAEKVARDQLHARFAARTGLSFELVIAPRHTVHRLGFKLGGGVAAAAACGACGASVRPGQRFCTGCGEVQPQVDVPDGLYTSDGASIELDVALSIQGEKAPPNPTAMLTATAARHLRTVPWAAVRTPEGMLALEAELQHAGAEAFAALGFRVVALDLVDARSQGDQWLLGARAQIEQSKAEITLGREWLAVRDDQLAIEELSAAVGQKAERIRRDAAYTARAAAVEDARRNAALAGQEREIARVEADAVHADAMAGVARSHTAAMTGARNRGEIEREALALESERQRKRAEDQAHADKLRRDARLAEVAGMAEIEARMADQEQRHRVQTMEALAGQSEAQMIAMQASVLAEKAHGAAFAEALGKLADGEAARRERERADDAAKASADALRELAKSAMESNAKVAAAKAGAPIGPPTCPTCGGALAVGARFCGGCGTSLV